MRPARLKNLAGFLAYKIRYSIEAELLDLYGSVHG